MWGLDALADVVPAGGEENSAVMDRNWGNALDGEEALYHLRKSLLCEPEQPALLNRLAHPEERSRRGGSEFANPEQRFAFYL